MKINGLGTMKFLAVGLQITRSVIVMLSELVCPGVRRDTLGIAVSGKRKVCIEGNFNICFC